MGQEKGEREDCGRGRGRALSVCPCGNVALHNPAESEDTQIHAPAIRHLSINPRPALGTATRRECTGEREGGGVG